MREFPKFKSSEKDHIQVSETFYSIQGEGKYIGTPSVFLRTQGCVLNCEWCDTYNIWKGGDNYSYSDLAEIWKRNGYLKAISSGAHIIFTGGEPLARQKELLGFRTYLQEHYYRDFYWTPFIEVETAGTLLPNELAGWINHYNVSPKLSSSGMSLERRVNSQVMDFYSSMTRSNESLGHITFKFVVRNRDDIEEAFQTYIDPYQINTETVYLMTEAGTRKQLQEREPEIVELAKEFGLNYSTRLHLHIWDKATGV